MSWLIRCDNCGGDGVNPETPDHVVPLTELPSHQGVVMGKIVLTLHDQPYHLCKECFYSVLVTPIFKRS